MYLLYLDDSGSVADPKQSYFVWAGVSVFERQAYWLAVELEKIAARFNPAEPDLVELHGSDMLQGRRSWKKIPLPDRIAAVNDALNVLARSHSSNRIFSAVVEKVSVTPEDPAAYAFEHVCSRFDRFLGRLHNEGDTHRGIVIFDKSTYEIAFQSLASRFRGEGHRDGVLRNLAEVPLFLDSRASRLVQLADLVAYSIFRAFEKHDRQFLDLISHRFDASGGIQHGLFVKQRQLGDAP